jgi:hypothetical protein
MVGAIPVLNMNLGVTICHPCLIYMQGNQITNRSYGTNIAGSFFYQPDIPPERKRNWLINNATSK